MKRGITRVVRSPSKGEQRVKLYGASDLHQIIGRLTCSSSNGWRLSRRTTIDARSWPNHRPIVARSPHDRRRSPRQKHHWWKLHDRSSIAMKSEPDRHAIKARSPRNRGTIVARLWPRSGLICRLIGGRGVVELKPQSMQKESLPRRHHSAPTTAPNDLKIGPKISFKTDVFSLLFF